MERMSASFRVNEFDNVVSKCSLRFIVGCILFDIALQRGTLKEDILSREIKMLILNFSDFKSKMIKKRFNRAASDGLLQPVFDDTGQLNVDYAKVHGFTKEHIFILRGIFKHRMKGKTHEEVLSYANEILFRMLRMREIYDDLDARVADKKEKGIY